MGRPAGDTALVLSAGIARRTFLLWDADKLGPRIMLRFARLAVQRPAVLAQSRRALTTKFSKVGRGIS